MLADATVVITGGSSGIGRAAAWRFAQRGARLVLAARGAEPLQTAAEECRRYGSQAIPVVCDVRDEAAVQRVADRAAEEFGSVDVWVNNAGVIAYGPFERIPEDVFRSVIETNLLGQVHGCRAALAHMRRQGAGVIINTASVWGRVSSPDVSAYVASKFAVRAFSECLREELADSRISVSTVLPQAVDTPIFANAANFDGRRARPIPPLLDPDVVARAIVSCAEQPGEDEVTCSRVGRLLELTHSLAPALYKRVVPAMFTAGNYGDQPADVGPGNTLAPLSASHRVGGGWREHHRRELRRALAAATWAGARALVGKR